MERKWIKRISSLLIAGVLTASMNVTAFADEGSVRTTDDKSSSFTGSGNTVSLAGSGTKIPLTKSIIFFNDDNANVYEPNITFSYRVAPAGITDGVYTVTETTSSNETVTVHVYNGIAEGVSGTDIAFGTTLGSTDTTTVTANADGTDVERTADLTVDLSKFDHAGVYRYVVTETTASDVTAAGLDERTSDYVSARYLDVYLKNKADSGLEMYGAVMFKSIASQPGTDSITSSATDKTSGFGPEGGSTSYADDKTVDKYRTYNFEVKKLVSGALADKTNEFPFYISLANSISGAKYTFEDENGVQTSEAVTGGVITKGEDSKSSGLKLRHGASVRFIGVPSSRTDDLSIIVKEWNNTFDAYSASVSLTNGSATVSNADMSANSDEAAAVSAFDIKANTTAGQVMTVTNTIKDISPTGLILRFAPFAIMAGFGIIFLALSRRHRKKDDKDII